MNKKVYYEVPSAELIIVRFEENFCATGDKVGNSKFEESAEIDDQSSQNWW